MVFRCLSNQASLQITEKCPASSNAYGLHHTAEASPSCTRSPRREHRPLNAQTEAETPAAANLTHTPVHACSGGGAAIPRVGPETPLTARSTSGTNPPPHPALPCRQPPQHPSVGSVAQQEDCPPATPRPAVPGTAAVEAARQTGQRQAVPCSSLGVCGPQQLSGFLSAQPAAVPERSPCPSALRPLLTLKPADRRLHTQAPLSPSPSETASICAGWVSHAAAGSAPASLQRVPSMSTSPARIPPRAIPCGCLRRPPPITPLPEQPRGRTRAPLLPPQAPRPAVPTGSGKTPAKGKAHQHPLDGGKWERSCRISLRCHILAARDGLKIKKQHERDLFFK